MKTYNSGSGLLTGLRRVILVLAVLVTVSLSPATLAEETNIWDFVNPGLYTVSDPRYIEVTGGVARLKLQASQINVNDLATYQTNAAASEFLSFGPDVLLNLGQSGSLYVPKGEYVSRIFDGGSGNRWDQLAVVAYNTRLLNAAGEIPVSTSNLLLLTHFNGTWKNEVTGQIGVPTAATFGTDAQVGSACGKFDGSSIVQYSCSVSARANLTFAFWINMKATSSDVQHALCFANSGSYVGAVEVGGRSISMHRPDNIELRLDNYIGLTPPGTFSTNELITGYT